MKLAEITTLQIGRILALAVLVVLVVFVGSWSVAAIAALVWLAGIGIAYLMLITLLQGSSSWERFITACAWPGLLLVLSIIGIIYVTMLERAPKAKPDSQRKE